MTKEDIFSIFDANAKKTRANMLVIVVVGILFVLGGLAFYLFLENDNITIGALFGGIGILLTLISAISLGTKSYEKKAAQMKDLINNNPKHIVWSYVFKQNNRGAISVNVIMNFKDGKQFQVDENAIPNKDTTGFMMALQEINPAMHVGYSEELEYKYKKGTL